ncbi:MAG: hypothetical protein PHC92_07545 [Syntrophomonadaceae bacterium]|nr:hypothetical protein [Syntrophomonadaceae bacterium]MDD3023812.1 hypothetical protein [Syntrophomonadaceae bacterium]
MNPDVSEQGTTLLEILIAMILMSILMSGLLAVYWTGNYAFARQSSISDAQYCARTAMQWIVQDILESCQSDDFMAIDSDCLTLQIPAAEAKAHQVHYYLNGANLRRNNLAVMDNIDHLNFTRDSGKQLITIIIEARVNKQSFRLVCSAVPRVSKAAGSGGGN